MILWVLRRDTVNNIYDHQWKNKPNFRELSTCRCNVKDDLLLEMVFFNFSRYSNYILPVNGHFVKVCRNFLGILCTKNIKICHFWLSYSRKIIGWLFWAIVYKYYRRLIEITHAALWLAEDALYLAAAAFNDSRGGNMCSLWVDSVTSAYSFLVMDRLECMLCVRFIAEELHRAMKSSCRVCWHCCCQAFEGTTSLQSTNVTARWMRVN